MKDRSVVIRFDIMGDETDEQSNRDLVAVRLDEIAAKLREGSVEELPIAILESNDVPAEQLREGGIVLEANRRFFHPIGLALSIVQLEDGTQHVVGLTDANDGEGWTFGPATSEEHARERKDRFRRFYEDNSPKITARGKALPYDGQPEQPISTLYGEWAIELALEDLTDADREFEIKLRRLYEPGEKIVGRGRALISLQDRRKQINQPPQGVVVRLVAAGRLHAGEVEGMPGPAIWLSEIPDLLAEILGNRGDEIEA